QEYISTGEPVGSRVVSRRYDLNVSPATIRNVMADLEEYGYLQQPHVSAGRVPTPEGIRFFLEEILQTKILPKGEKTMISRHLAKSFGSIKDTLHETSLLLSEISQNAAIIILPKLSTFILKRIEFLRLDDKRILVILISKSGMVYNHIVQGEDIAQDELTKYSNFLNETYADMSIQKVRDMLVGEMTSEKARFDDLVRKAMELGKTALESVEDCPEVVIEGKESVFNYPEFSDIDRLREIVRAFEDKGRILRLLNQVIADSGVKVFVGEELGALGMRDFSMVASGYFRGDTPVGTLGVIGPLRMDYARVIPLVEYVAKVLSNLLEDI
ncbi:MAG TPA: heat-inducible transcriptional repressor HrcA, partial [Deltaproteobacteria bacterium]|nr:heat-inducible transcriptional repressor HrcA [Deltaproteobacteria bacterium]